MRRRKGLGERSRARDDNCRGDGGRGAAWPRGTPGTGTQERGRDVFFGSGCLSRWRGLATLSTLESWIRLYARFERLWCARSDARRRQQTQSHQDTRGERGCTDGSRWLSFTFWFYCSFGVCFSFVSQLQMCPHLFPPSLTPLTPPCLPSINKNSTYLRSGHTHTCLAAKLLTIPPVFFHSSCTLRPVLQHPTNPSFRHIAATRPAVPLPPGALTIKHYSSQSMSTTALLNSR